VKVSVFTSNQPRHLALINALAEIAEEVFAVQECTTVFPGEVDDFYRRTEVMQRYFSRVIAAERKVFGGTRFLSGNVRQIGLKMGDLSRLPLQALAPALDADIFIVFGASYIRGPLIEALIERKAINIHMGTSPYYRGSSCNFWAMYDKRPEYVGATIHRLSSGLDSGDMLFHAFPAEVDADPFVYGMQAVRSAHHGLCSHIADGTLLSLPAVQQDRSLELRYTRNRDFTDEVAADYLDHLPELELVRAAINGRDPSKFLNPFLG
jgi:hypothetical protein